MVQPTPAGEAFQNNGVWYQDYNVYDETTGRMVVKRYFHNGVDWVPEQVHVQAPMAQQAPARIDLAKNIPNTAAGVSLKKNVVNLDKCLVDLSKSSGINFEVHHARVAVVMDFSGSMRQAFRNGSVQRTLNRLVPLGLRFDDNGELDVWLFNGRSKRIEGLCLDNFENYVDEIMLKSGMEMGTTSYSPVLTDVLKKYTSEDVSRYPAFVIFITDGSNDDRRNTDAIIRKTSQYNVFIQFVGLGTMDDFKYLKKLDDLTGRQVDNTGFIQVKDFDKMDDEQLYKALLEQYIDWLKALGIK